jgi:hypothetical protein
MEFALTKIYTKFYISMILNSISYQDVLKNRELIENFVDTNPDLNISGSKSSNNITPPKRAHTSTNYNDAKYRRVFMYNNVYYSKVEIMGLVVEMQIWGPDDKVRYLLYVDDGTGVIQAIVWKNYNKAVFEKVQLGVV